MNDRKKLLIETNPIAYEELIDFIPDIGRSAYSKETLPCDALGYFGEWKCPSQKHTWISTIEYRSHPKTDPGCPICKNQKLNLNPTLFAHRFHYSTYRTWVEGLWYCKNCYAFYWAKDTEDMFEFDYHNEMHCTPGTPSFKEKFPEIAKMWSNKNFVSADKIQYNYENEFKFIWDCQTCGMSFKASMYKVRNYEVPCPYCAGRLPFPKKSFAALYPKLASSWNHILTQARAEKIGNDEIRTPETVFPDNRSYGYFTCPDCGVIRSMHIGDLIAEEKCPHCAVGMTKDYSEKLYRGFAVKTNEYLKPTQKQAMSFHCPDCNQRSYIKPIDAFFMKKTCKYCSGDIAIPGKTSFKALYPEIERELIYDEKVDIDTDKITYKYSARQRALNWNCNECHMVWSATIYERVTGKRTCPYCAGTKAHPDRTSLYAQYTNLINTEWKYQNNILLVDPRMELPTSPKTVWWKCMYCGKSYKTSIKKRVRDYLRSRNSCTYCHGFTRVKFRN